MLTPMKTPGAAMPRTGRKNEWSKLQGMRNRSRRSSTANDSRSRDLRHGVVQGQIRLHEAEVAFAWARMCHRLTSICSRALRDTPKPDWRQCEATHESREEIPEMEGHPPAGTLDHAQVGSRCVVGCTHSDAPMPGAVFSPVRERTHATGIATHLCRDMGSSLIPRVTVLRLGLTPHEPQVRSARARPRKGRAT